MIHLLLDPNVAYIMIVIGFLLTIFAILTPGTGFLEVAAAVMLFIIGYQVSAMPINIWALILLLACIVPFIFALRQRRVTMNLLLTGLCFTVGSSFLFHEGIWWRPAVHPTLAIVVSVLGGGLFYVMASKSLEARAKAPSHDLSKLIGAVGEARSDIDPEGSVYINREMWTAYSEKKIKTGQLVIVVDRTGLILNVEPYNNK
jgi:membrane-bound serine protease (ClpP class)